jgi:TolB-like protein
VVRDDPAPLQSPLSDIVKRCLAKQPAQHFQSIAEVRAALESISIEPVDQQPSIAVLPFANIGKDQENEYFSDGLAEEIINFLTQIPGPKVTARTSAFAFKGKTEDIRKIADTLGVTTILEGSVRRSGLRLRVTAQLINAQDGYHLWSDKRGLVECGAGNSVRGLVPRGKAYLGERCGRSADRCRGDYCA